ncbi:rhomboid family intramembrane serine protease [Croceitalea rosinachiae]|uniref:Rhomboid family intramembrane serine protease n=1 Tax=Croceitalea rosinachiae TaxID=3075596 RepID=A0ABU3ACM2_9FLAO|nr:rhomboid family intramembrane serine protease [Croceitalea sp. F388]MDT0607924.1 rhomboid family intramembrane serine protease [Croceitalea sp. F388]
MQEARYFKFSIGMLLVPLFSVLSIWTVFWIELQLGVDFNDYGISPRKLLGLQGILFGPFIHGSIEHLYNNTIPLAVLTLTLFYFYQKDATKVLLSGVVIAGFLTWLIGRPSYHIGASGLIYVLASFIFFKGVFTKYYRLIALSLAIVFIYGSMLWYIFPIEEGISWEGHLSGFVTGLLLARIIKSEIPEPKKYKWEQDDFNEEEDEFLRHFDENGNFIEKTTSSDEEAIKVIYDFKKSKKNL